MTRVLITGGSGFIGRNLLESFLYSKYRIFAPSHSELDLLDTENVDYFFKNNNFDVVIHAATKPGHRNALDHTNLFYSNIRMFQNLERNKNHFGKFINLGSGAIYDISKNITNASENAIFWHMGKDDHSFCKYVVSKQINILPNFVDLNIFGIFGKYEDYSIRFISNAICKAIFNLPITLRQNRKFSYIDVNDLPNILDWFIENDPLYHSYNITTGEFVELKNIAELVRDVSGKDIEIKIYKDGYGLDYYGKNDRLLFEMKNIKFKQFKKSVEDLYKYYIKIKDKLVYENLLIDK